ncbi:MAG: restriction endonuclease subunit R, partial [Sphaerospermopsis kisseleviana]
EVKTPQVKSNAKAGMITNGNEFLFLKVLEHKYANSRLFSLVNPDNELYSVLQVLKRLGMEVIAFSAT